MRKCKTKAIQADLAIFTHIPLYLGIPRNYSGLIRHTQNPIFLTYSEPRYMYLEPEAYLEVFAKIVYGYNYFRKSQLFSQHQLFK